MGEWLKGQDILAIAYFSGTVAPINGKMQLRRQAIWMVTIIWSDYLQYRARLRGFDLARIEQILRYSQERYYDMETGRMIAVGRDDHCLVVIPYEEEGETITPVTIHATTRPQIQLRLRNGRYGINE